MELSLIVMVMTVCCMPVIEARCKKRNTTAADPCDDCIMVSVLSLVDTVMYKYRLCDGGGQGVCHPSRGRLEVNYNNKWGSICDTNWSYNSKRVPNTNANTACQMFPGFTFGVEAPFGPAPARFPIHLDNVQCSGDASIADCSHAPWGQVQCSHSDDVGIACFSGN